MNFGQVKWSRCDLFLPETSSISNDAVLHMNVDSFMLFHGCHQLLLFLENMYVIRFDWSTID